MYRVTAVVSRLLHFADSDFGFREDYPAAMQIWPDLNSVEQAMKQPNRSRRKVVADHRGLPVYRIFKIQEQRRGEALLSRGSGGGEPSSGAARKRMARECRLLALPYFWKNH